MLTPISWLKDFVDIKLPLKDLMWKMTEAGLTCETYTKTADDTLLDIEVTANRPDWMSITGVARDLAGILGKSYKNPDLKQIPTPKTPALPLIIDNDFNLCPRLTALIIKDVQLAPSPGWLQQRLISLGLRPINNLVDITNYVMFEMGNPIHVFDYDKITDSKMKILKSAGGESFVSVDDKAYTLPKDAIIFKSGGEVIDLCGIKGGLNSGVSPETKNILLMVAVYNGPLVRRAGQKLGLFSDASRIFERGANSGGTLDSLKRVCELILRLAQGKVASRVIDIKAKSYDPWHLELSLSKLKKVLGIEIPIKTVLSILKNLNLTPKLIQDKVVCIIPTYRGDLKIEADLIEEVARIYGYNNFPKTLPFGTTPSTKIPYSFDDSFHLKLKNLFTASGFNEAMTLTLLSSDLIQKCKGDPAKHIRIANPISSEYEYLRTSLLPNLLMGVKENSTTDLVQLFELDKVYLGMLDKSDEPYKLVAIVQGLTYRQFKGDLDLLLERLKIDSVNFVFEVEEKIWHPYKSATLTTKAGTLGVVGQINPEVVNNLGLSGEIFALELDITTLQKASQPQVYKNVSSYPAHIEDLTFTLQNKTRLGDIISTIKAEDKQISKVELKDTFNDSYTFRIWYLNPDKTLSNVEVKDIREKIITKLKKTFGVIHKT